MTAIITPPPTLTPAAEPRPRRWTKAEYHAMWDLGWFNDQRVELLDGEILQMPNPGPPHFVSTDKISDALRTAFPADRYWVRMQGALNLGMSTEPQPDVAVADGPRPSYAGHPTTALLVVEVSDTTLSIDRGCKASLYARAGIADYWVVNLNARQLEVHRRPVTDPEAEHGARYEQVTVLGPADSVSPLAAPSAVFRVADLLP